MTAAGFLIDYDDAQLEFYPNENALRFPFPWSEQRIGYVDALAGNQTPLAELHVAVLTDRWVLPDATRRQTSLSFDAWLATRPRGPKLHGEVARLADCAGATLSLQKVSYEDYARSNLLMDHRPTEGARSLREMITQRGTLGSLAQSPLANPLGASLIAINQYDEIPLQVRAQTLAVRPGEICSTSSGTFELSDIPGDGGPLSACNLLRETAEEMGQGFATRLAAPEALGLAREFARGGQPELFLLSRGEFTRDDVFSSLHQANATGDGEVSDVIFLTLQRDGDHYDAKAAAESIAKLQTAHPIAAPLRCHLAFLFAALARRGALR